MPRTGMPISSSSRRSSGAPSEYTEAGPPDSTSAPGRRSLMLSKSVVCGRSSAKTPHSRIRRAMSCEYWPPKSRTSTSSRAVSGAWTSAASDETASDPVTPLAAVGVAGTAAPSVIADGYSRRHRGPPVGSHADGLLALELLALRLECRRHHHLGPLEVPDVLVPACGHGGLEGSHEVERAVVLLGGTEEDLLETPVLNRGDPGAAGKQRVEGGHPPVEPASGSLLGARERRADHHRVRAAGDGLRHVATRPHAAVGDDVAVLAGLAHVLRAGGSDVRDRGGLGHADAENAARGAGGSRPDPDEDADRTGAHEVESGGVRRTATHDARHRHLGDELLEVERLGLRGDVLRRDHSALDHEDVEARLESDLVMGRDALRCERPRGHHSLRLDLLDPLSDELRLDGLAVDLLHRPRRDR